MLNVIVFACGAALMALEIVAARVLAPALGNSIFVWGSVISIVMIALSLGYWLGGQLADKRHSARALAPLIAGAGVLTVIVPVIAAAVLPMAANMGPRIGSLVASALIFFLPALLIATVSPLGVRLAASRGLTHIGRSAGGLYAISTGGSIVGTLATSFWLIPLLSLEPLIVGIGFVLFASALLSLALPRLYPEEPLAEKADTPAVARALLRPAALAVALVVLGGVLGGWVLAGVASTPTSDIAGERVLHREDSQYHRITVTQADNVRHLRFDASNQTAIDMADGYRSVIQYPNYADLALAVNPKAKRVLVLGLGGGAIPKRWWRDYPDMTIDTVEIDPAVVRVSKEYFDLPDDPRIRVFTQDARRFVQTSTDTYDVIFVDAYYADSLPFHLTTNEFFGEVKARLAPDGVVAYNAIGSVTGDRSKLFRGMHKTVSANWKNVWVFPIGIGDSGLTDLGRNIIVLASDADVSDDELVRRITTSVDGRVKLAEYPSFAEDLYSQTIVADDVPLLTDAYAPVDSLIKVN
jgi:predicted membrane-bound spermidine synthase